MDCPKHAYGCKATILASEPVIDRLVSPATAGWYTAVSPMILAVQKPVNKKKHVFVQGVELPLK